MLILRAIRIHVEGPSSIHFEDRFTNNFEGHLPYILNAVQHAF